MYVNFSLCRGRVTNTNYTVRIVQVIGPAYAPTDRVHLLSFSVRTYMYAIGATA